MIEKLSKYYKLERDSKKADEQNESTVHNQGTISLTTDLAELPRPKNVTVLIISYYPPILKLSWNLDEELESNYSKLLDLNLLQELDTQQSLNESSKQIIESSSQASEVGRVLSANESIVNREDEELLILQDLKRRQELIGESLTCFQVTYKIIDSK